MQAAGPTPRVSDAGGLGGVQGMPMPLLWGPLLEGHDLTVIDGGIMPEDDDSASCQPKAVPEEGTLRMAI